uniref:Probable protein phosphatase 2C 37 n=2 Tax=Oryza sativa subsp. japonica TaxID=39947 RepID=P2C37_ORYSJ|nr:RecName: Full=Probable protein phosphatase 2C 37; Short=OsPP2C37 [Oryza sativa Japonica Group]
MVMASAGVNMPGGDGDHPPAAAQECHRLRRRRYVPAAAAASEDGDNSSNGGGEKRSLPASSASPSPSPTSSAASSDCSSDRDDDGCSSTAGAAARRLPLPSGASTAAAVWPVAFGSVSLAGRMRDMEDAVSLRPSFCTWLDGSPMHFFAVFDGHGGPHVSALCREQMHVIVAEEMVAEAAALRQRQPAAMEEEEEERAVAGGAVAELRPGGRAGGGGVRVRARHRAGVPCPLSGQTGAIIGSTAVVALLVRDRLVVSNCGDSRAVLCRAGDPLPLSSDHKGLNPSLSWRGTRVALARGTWGDKTGQSVGPAALLLSGGAHPDRPDEKARIEAVGGRVVYLNGPRVRGILAMSRALGDKYLKPEVICEPDITITVRTVDDECLILASDGMWDVISNETASDVARQCLEDGSPTSGRRAARSGEAASSSAGAPAAAVGQESEPRCYRAAALLARLALGRESSDNISVVVIDLKGRG